MMATGRLGTADLAATTVTDVYTCPASTVASVNINLCNRNASPASVRLALSDTSVTQKPGEYLIYDLSLSAAGGAGAIAAFEGVMMDAGKIVTAYSDSANVSVVVTGVEEAV